MQYLISQFEAHQTGRIVIVSFVEFTGLIKRMNLGAKIVMSVEISHRYFSPPVQIHIHSTVTDQHTLEIQFSTFYNSIGVFDEHFS